MPISSGSAEKERKTNAMNNPQEIQEQYRQYRSSLYDEYPQAARFEQSKRRFAQILMLLCLAVHLSFLYQTGTTSGGVTGYDILRTVSAMGTEIIFLLAAMGPRRRMAPLLYLLALYRLAYPAGANQFLPEMITALSGTDFGQEPLAAAITVCSLLYGLLILAAAMWLTLPPKNKKLAEELEQLNLKLQQFIKEHPVE